MRDPNKILENARKKMKDYVVGQQSRDDHAEIHTPSELITDMLSEIPEKEWKSPKKTWYDPCTGIGNFTAFVAENLMDSLKGEISDPKERYRHIMEKQIYMAELQLKNVVKVEELLNPSGELNLNIKCVDSLELQTEYMEPSDWNQHRFRTHYKTSDFFNYEPKPEEFEKLEKVKEFTDNEDIIENFGKGYK